MRLSPEEVRQLQRLAKKAGVRGLQIPRIRLPYHLSRGDIRNINDRLSTHDAVVLRVKAGKLRVFHYEAFASLKRNNPHGRTPVPHG